MTFKRPRTVPKGNRTTHRLGLPPLLLALVGVLALSSVAPVLGAPFPGPAPTFPLHVDAPTRRLVDAAGQPFLITGDAAWSLMVRLNQNEVRQYLDDRRARGFNTVLVNLIEHYFGGPANIYGDAPFLIPGDFSTPNEAYFANVDFVIDQARQRGILVLLAPMYLGYNGGEQGWYQEMLANGTATPAP